MLLSRMDAPEIDETIVFLSYLSFAACVEMTLPLCRVCLALLRGLRAPRLPMLSLFCWTGTWDSGWGGQP